MDRSNSKERGRGQGSDRSRLQGRFQEHAHVKTRAPEYVKRTETLEELKLGKRQTLSILRESDHGVYLGVRPDSEETVLLPKRQVPEGAKTGDTVEVFLYRDSSDRLIATTAMPAIELDGLAVLTVREVTAIGAFLDWGLEKDLFLPFKEQIHKVKPQERVVVGLYLDKSSRLCATMRIQRFLSAESPYHKEDKVQGIIYELHPELGAFVAVDGKYFGLIPKQEWYEDAQVGDTVNARVLRVRKDGKLDLSGRKKSYKQMGTDADMIWEKIVKNGGMLPFSDTASPEMIREMTGLSKNAFKRAVGHLLKEGKIEIGENAIRKKSI